MKTMFSLEPQSIVNDLAACQEGSVIYLAVRECYADMKFCNPPHVALGTPFTTLRVYGVHG